jgi:hypothetical protein
MGQNRVCIRILHQIKYSGCRIVFDTPQTKLEIAKLIFINNFDVLLL